MPSIHCPKCGAEMRSKTRQGLKRNLVSHMKRKHPRKGFSFLQLASDAVNIWAGM